jgi:hypothetical protein
MGAIHHLHRGAIDRHRIHLRRPAAVDLIHRPGASVDTGGRISSRLAFSPA